MKVIIRIVILLISVLLACALYLHFFNIEMNDTSIEAAITKRIGHDSNIKDIKHLDGHHFVYFSYTKKTIEYQGFITLLQGLNKKYRLGNGYFESINSQLVFTDIEMDQTTYLIVYGETINSDRLLINGNLNPFEIEINHPDHIFYVGAAKGYGAAVMGYTYKENDNTVVVQVDNGIEAIIDYTGELNSGPSKIVMLSSLLIVLIGFVVSLLFTPEINRLEKLYYKLIKEIPIAEDSDGNDYNMLN